MIRFACLHSPLFALVALVSSIAVSGCADDTDETLLQADDASEDTAGDEETSSEAMALRSVPSTEPLRLIHATSDCGPAPVLRSPRSGFDNNSLFVNGGTGPAVSVTRKCTLVAKLDVPAGHRVRISGFQVHYQPNTFSNTADIHVQASLQGGGSLSLDKQLRNGKNSNHIESASAKRDEVTPCGRDTAFVMTTAFTKTGTLTPLPSEDDYLIRLITANIKMEKCAL